MPKTVSGARGEDGWVPSDSPSTSELFSRCFFCALNREKEYCDLVELPADGW